MASNPLHPHDTRYHPGSGAAAAAAHNSAAPSMRTATTVTNGPGAQWTFGATLPPEAGDAIGRDYFANAEEAHQFGPIVDGFREEISTNPALPVPALREYSGFEVAMNKSGERMLEPVIVERELKWQREELLAEQPQAQSDFRDMMLQQQHFRGFALMTESSSYITIVHSVGKYFPPIDAEATKFAGQYIGFVGDRKQSRSPVPISLPKEVWEWTVPMVYLDYDAVAAYYETEAHYATLFKHPAESNESAKGKGGKKKAEEPTKAPRQEEVAVPFMLSLPSCIISELTARTRWTPYDLLQLVDQKIIDFDLQVQHEHWKVMREWCLAACHMDGTNPKRSLLGVSVHAVTDDDDELHEWIETRLDMTMGQRHFKALPAATMDNNLPAERVQPSATLGGDDLATQVGRGIAMGFQTFNNANLLSSGAGIRAGLSSAVDVAKTYSPDSIAAIKGFSGTDDITALQPIWATFQTTKNLDVQRRHIEHGMEQWARKHGVELDRGIYFEQKTIEDIVNLRFNPGQGVAQFKSAEKGLSLLVCRSRTPEEIERVRDREQAEQLTQATRVLEEALKLQRGDPRAPASNYFELKLNITSFCALVYTLFGDKCGYYQALMRVRNCMDTGGVFNIRQAYTADVCHRIAWAIIDDGRSFFSKVLIQQDFESEVEVTYPESLLDAILVDVRFANPVNRPSYPHEWNPKAPVQAAPMIQWTPPAALPPQPPARGTTQAATPQQARATAQWVDNRHPAIVAMMQAYLSKLGDNVYVGEILDGAGIRLTDLPIPTGTRFASRDGKSAHLCWNAVLGRCKFGSKCKYKRNHPAAGELPDSYAAAVVQALQRGVDYVVSTKESPQKKVKTEVVVVA